MKSAVIVGGVVVLVVFGGVGLFYATSASGSTLSTTSLKTGGDSSTVAEQASSATNTGYQISYVPYGSWAKYLGPNLPAGYDPAPRSVNSNIWPCPSGYTTAQCQVFQQTCGNGVCDPNETCSSCPIDCGVTGDLVCDPYTGRAGSPASICQIAEAQQAGNGAG